MSNHAELTLIEGAQRRYRALVLSRLPLAISNLIFDLSGRQGVGDEYQRIESDIQNEIFQSWVSIVSETICPPWGGDNDAD